MSDPRNQWLVIFVKAPMVGRVKTRLATGIGALAATAFYRRETANLLRRLGNDPRWQTVLAVSPDHFAEDPTAFPIYWPGSLPRVAQGKGDLGHRMGRVFENLPPGPAVIIGSDIPAIEVHHIHQAFRSLGTSDAVFGPSEDGGYWLVGQKRCPRILSLFDGVRWSTKTTLQDTLDNLPSKAKVRFLESLNDIDDASDYNRWIDGSSPP
jgi:rSAM/selenodomain-associated transferase 1